MVLVRAKNKIRLGSQLFLSYYKKIVSMFFNGGFSHDHCCPTSWSKKAVLDAQIEAARKAENSDAIA